MARHPRRTSLRIILITVGIAVVVFVGAVLAFYKVDTDGGPRTLRGLRIDAHEAGNLTPRELDDLLAELSTEVAERDVRINLPDGSRLLKAADVGIGLDTDDLASRAWAVGQQGGFLDRFRAWLGSFTSTRSISSTLAYDPARATKTVSGLDGLLVAPPTEPRLTLATGEGLIVNPGQDGVRVDEDAVVFRLGKQVEAGGPFNVDAPTMPLPPTTDEGELADLATQLNVLTKDGARVRLLGTEKMISARSLRTRLDIVPGEDGPRPIFDLTSLQGLIELTFRGLGDVAIDPTFDIVDDTPVIVEEGTPPTECCDPESAAAVAEAVLADRPGAVDLEPRPVTDPDRILWATGSQIVEKVAEFTTNHSCCESRVTNIHKFADIVRGVYLRPGQSLSLNEHVGERTRERGFVPAGTILQGHLVPTVGGGVSQFATTMFNAAFFAGFDFVDYQSHSIYFSRYPYGREATISWPAPDLEFTNTTDYPALIWTSYDDTSITVSIYSTKSVIVTEGRQEVSSARSCTRVDTYRLREYDDGREVEDSVFATYRPGEGLDCNGNPTTKPND